MVSLWCVGWARVCTGCMEERSRSAFVARTRHFASLVGWGQGLLDPGLVEKKGTRDVVHSPQSTGTAGHGPSPRPQEPSQQRETPRRRKPVHTIPPTAQRRFASKRRFEFQVFVKRPRAQIGCVCVCVVVVGCRSAVPGRFVAVHGLSPCLFDCSCVSFPCSLSVALSHPSPLSSLPPSLFLLLLLKRLQHPGLDGLVLSPGRLVCHLGIAVVQLLVGLEPGHASYIQSLGGTGPAARP